MAFSPANASLPFSGYLVLIYSCSLSSIKELAIDILLSFSSFCSPPHVHFPPFPHLPPCLSNFCLLLSLSSPYHIFSSVYPPFFPALLFPTPSMCQTSQSGAHTPYISAPFFKNLFNLLALFPPISLHSFLSHSQSNQQPLTSFLPSLFVLWSLTSSPLILFIHLVRPYALWTETLHQLHSFCIITSTLSIYLWH